MTTVIPLCLNVTLCELCPVHLSRKVDRSCRYASAQYEHLVVNLSM